jgi:hypothetical protein
MKYLGDEDEDRDKILEMLGGEVDDFAGSQLEDPDSGRFGKGPKAGGTTITITVEPGSQGPSDKGAEDEEEAGGIDKDSQKKEEEDEPHDPIAHILGMCGGGCPK